MFKDAPNSSITNSFKVGFVAGIKEKDNLKPGTDDPDVEIFQW